MWCLWICAPFISLSIMPSKSLLVVRNGQVSFFVVDEWYSLVYMHHIVFVRLGGSPPAGSPHCHATGENKSTKT